MNAFCFCTNMLFFSGAFRIIWFVVSNMIKLFARRVVNSLHKLHVTNNKKQFTQLCTVPNILWIPWRPSKCYEAFSNCLAKIETHTVRTESCKMYKWTINSECKVVFFLTLETTNSLKRAPGLFGQPAADRKATLIVCPMSVLSNWTVSVHMIFLRRFCIISGLTFTNRKLEQPYITFDDLSWFCCQRILRSLPASAESWFMSPAFMDGVLIQITQCAVYSPIT